MRPLTLAQAARKRMRILRRPPESIQPASPRPQRRDCHGRLGAQLLALADDDVALIDSGIRAWCSATFVGAHHHFVLRWPAENGGLNCKEMATRLPEAEFLLPGHIVADIVVDALDQDETGARRMTVRALTVEDW